MTGEEVLEFEDTSFTRFRRKLLRTKGGQEQYAFLEAVREDEMFLALIAKHVATQGSKAPPLCRETLTEDQFKLPPAETEAELYDAWSSLTPRIACRTTFWGSVTYRHIKSGRIRSAYLAAEGGSSAGGSRRIDRLLQRDRQTGLPKAIDDCVRAVLRRFGGLPEARGNRSVYVNCPFGRAWWREHLVREVSGQDVECAKKVREVARVNQEYWETLVSMLVSRNSTFGSRKIRSIFILSLADLMDRNPDTRLRVARRLKSACRFIGVTQAARELSILDNFELRDLIDQIILSHD